jgi:NADH:ubiquinone oxidoreductase subunit 5 (subunit L)/multisubunit Na+/H+ antiporter MnhA subunit
LADATEGPTPVSASLHAATMVTAGIFLILRCSIISEYSGVTIKLLLIIGSITAIYAGICALVQYDIKKIIAYSTCSQLGYMLFTCGLSNYNLAFAHLSLHAFSKALLFPSAGAVIHFCLDEQDIRHLHKLYHYLPFIYICMLIGSLSITGFPFSTGFYSKDLIIESAYTRFIVEGYFIHFASMGSAISTTIYSIRLFHRLFRVPYGMLYLSMSHRKHILLMNKKFADVPLPMFISLFRSTLLSIIIGYLASEILMGLGIVTIVNYILLQNSNYIVIESIPPIVKNLPFPPLLFFIFIAAEIQQYIFVTQDMTFLGIR